MIPSALRSSSDSSSRDFSFIQSSTPGVPGSSIPSGFDDAAWRICAVTGMGEPSNNSSWAPEGEYGGGGAYAKWRDVDLRAFAGGRGRRGVVVELVVSMVKE